MCRNNWGHKCPMSTVIISGDWKRRSPCQLHASESWLTFKNNEHIHFENWKPNLKLLFRRKYRLRPAQKAKGICRDSPHSRRGDISQKDRVTEESLLSHFQLSVLGSWLSDALHPWRAVRRQMPQEFSLVLCEALQQPALDQENRTQRGNIKIKRSPNPSLCRETLITRKLWVRSGLPGSCLPAISLSPKRVSSQGPKGGGVTHVSKVNCRPHEGRGQATLLTSIYQCLTFTQWKNDLTNYWMKKWINKGISTNK